MSADPPSNPGQGFLSGLRCKSTIIFHHEQTGIINLNVSNAKTSARNRRTLFGIHLPRGDLRGWKIFGKFAVQD